MATWSVGNKSLIVYSFPGHCHCDALLGNKATLATNTLSVPTVPTHPPRRRRGSKLGLKWRTLIKKFTVAALHEFIPSLASYFELSCWIWPPLEAALSLIASKVIRLSTLTALMTTTRMARMAREMTLIMIRDAPVRHQCITVSTISSSRNTQQMPRIMMFKNAGSR